MARSESAARASEEDLQLAEHRRRLFKGVCLSWFFAVVAHTLNLQSEAILIRNACKGDLGRNARVVSQCNAAAGLLGIIVNQVGGRLSDALGRKSFCLLGPIAQLLAGAVVFARPDSLRALIGSKLIRGVFTTFSGTVVGTACLRDCFEGRELGIKVAEAGGVVGVAIMVGPLLEGLLLRRFKAGGERMSYLCLAALGLVNAGVAMGTPETLGKASRTALDMAAVLKSANPFGFAKLYTHGTGTLKKLATIQLLQSMIDGKTMSDLSQIWMREHLRLSVESIRNFVMGFGLLSAMAGKQLTPALLKRTSTWTYTTLTNTTNLVAFSLRGLYEQSRVFFGVLPLMLPGVNGASSAAVNLVMNSEMAASGFGVGESTAWVNNLRALAGIAATLIYGYFYSWCKQHGLYPGHTFAVAGFLGAGLPQAILMLCVKRSELDRAGRS